MVTKVLSFFKNWEKPSGFSYFFVIFALAAILIYISGITYPFIYDDLNAITENTKLHRFNLIENIWCDLRQIRVWQNLSFALDWFISGPSPWSFRVTNLLLHLLNSFLLFKILDRLNYQSEKIYLLTLMFFIAPIQLQSVHYVMGRTTLIQAFFYLVISLLFLSETKRKSLIFFFLITSLLSKESVLLIPSLLLGLDVILKKFEMSKSKVKEYCLYFSVIPIYCIIFMVLRDPISMYNDSAGLNLFPFFRYLWTQFYYFLFYIFLIINPAAQAIIHVFPPWNIKIQVLGLLGLMGMMLLVYRTLKSNNRILQFLLLLFVLNLLPTNSIIQMVNPFAEYRLYLSNALLLYLMVEGIFFLTDKFAIRKAQKLLIGLILAYQIIFLLLNIRLFSDDKMSFLYAFELYPESAESNFYYGGVLENKKNPEAEKYFIKALEYYHKDPHPKKFDYAYVLALHYFNTERYGESIDVLEKNNELSDSEIGQSYHYYNLLSNNYGKMGNLQKAEEMKKKADIFKVKDQYNRLDRD